MQIGHNLRKKEEMAENANFQAKSLMVRRRLQQRRQKDISKSAQDIIILSLVNRSKIAENLIMSLSFSFRFTQGFDYKKSMLISGFTQNAVTKLRKSRLPSLCT